VFFQVDQNGPVALPFSPGPIVHADRPHSFDRKRRPILDSAKNGIRAGGHLQPLGQAGSGLAAQNITDHVSIPVEKVARIPVEKVATQNGG
jgi:hypothetical protein